MKPSKIQSAHDHFFGQSMSRIEIAKSLLFAFVKTIILKNIDFSSLEIYKGDWIDEKLQESRSDILYRAKLLNQDEHNIDCIHRKRSTFRIKNNSQAIHLVLRRPKKRHGVPIMARMRGMSAIA